VYVGTVLRLMKFCLVILEDCHNKGDLLKNLCQHRKYFFGNKLGWHLVHEDDAYSLYSYCVWTNLKNFLIIANEVH